MKKYLLIAFVFVAAFSFTSCETCTTCTYELGGVSFTSPEYCGSNSEVKDLEDAYKASAEAAGDLAGETVTVTCVEAD